MAKVQKQVTKIQAMFRAKLAMRKLEKDVQAQKAKLALRAQKAKGVSSEQIAL